jgi:hypothetical protein
VPTAHSDGEHPAVPVQTLPWQVHVASTVGAGHVRNGRPNQDSVGHRPLTRPDGSAVLAVAVADGHGDSRHFRSGQGSALAIAAGLAAVEAWTAPAGGGAEAVRDSAGRTLVTDIVARWDAAVAADLSADPFSDAERSVLARMSLPDVIAYGSTLLVAVFTAEFAIFTQIGDGDIVAVLPDGRSRSPVPADDSLDGWQTTSLCQEDAVEAFRTGVVPLADCPLFAVLLATDGFGNAQVDDPWPPGFAADLVQLGLDHEPGWLASQLPGWAAQCASAEGSGDDTTVALAVCSDAAPGPAAGKPTAQDAATVTLGPVPAVRAPSQQWNGQAAGRPDHGRSLSQQVRLRLWWLVAGVAVILGGIGLALALSGNSQPRPGPAPQPVVTHQTSPRPQPSVHRTHKTSRTHKPHKTHEKHKARTRPARKKDR